MSLIGLHLCIYDHRRPQPRPGDPPAERPAASRDGHAPPNNNNTNDNNDATTITITTTTTNNNNKSNSNNDNTTSTTNNVKVAAPLPSPFRSPKLYYNII